MNNTLEGIKSRVTEAKKMDKWLGVQNSGNNCCKAEYRKKNEKKGTQHKRLLGQH